MELNDVLTKDLDLSKARVFVNSRGEYDVEYVEEEEQPTSTNKRKRPDIVFGVVPEFEHLEHTNKKLDEPEINLPPETDPHKPNSIFSLFFCNEILEVIVTNSNKYAKKNIDEQKENQLSDSHEIEERPWKDMSVKELKIWIALVIYQGIYKSPAITDYWNTDPRFPIHNISHKMSLTRFQQIKRYLHISSDFKRTKYYYEKVNPLMDHIQNVSRELYTPKSNVSLDEMIVPFKGRSKDTFRIKLKPKPQGYKVIALCDSGYTFSFYPTSISEKDNIPTVKGLSQTGQLVHYLVSKLDYKRFAYNVYMDNFFSSIELFKRFKEMGIGACGTVKKPVVLSSELLLKAKKVEWNTRAGFVKDGVLALFWKDNGPVTMLTTIHRLTGSGWEVLKNRRRPRLTSTNGKQVSEQYGEGEYVKEFSIPSVVNDYNQNMNGVDRADQLRSYYATQIISRRIWFPMFFWLLDTAIFNSYRIARLKKSKLSHKKFRKELCWELIFDAVGEVDDLSVCTGSAPKKLSNNYQPDKSRFIGSHIVKKIEKGKVCHLCRWKDKENIPSHNLAKTPESMMYCETCDACFCVNARNCFYDYHTKSIDHLKIVTH